TWEGFTRSGWVKASAGSARTEEHSARTEGRGTRSLDRLFDLLEHVLGAGRDRCAGPVDAFHAGFVELLVVLARDHAADEHDDVVRTLFPQLGDDGWHQGLVAGGQRGHAHGVHVV